MSGRARCTVCGAETWLSGCYHGHCTDKARADRLEAERATCPRCGLLRNLSGCDAEWCVRHSEPIAARD